MQPPILTVADYLTLLNHALRTVPEGIVVEGEVADYKISQGKWVNFDLKDEKADAKISCFATTFQLTTPLANGMRVQVKGYPKVFERFGKLSYNVETVTPVGEGALQKAYELLKKKLQDEGLFDVGRKRAIPRFPNSIGLITSKEAAAYGDFLRVVQNRWSGVTIIHTPVHVQGQFAVPEILAAFAQFNAMPASDRPEVLVLTRGGGSLEDLHAFNDESVARAVFGCSLPVIVGVGHERDESLCDYVADVRASTPSNAAERVVPDRRDLLRSLDYAVDHMSATLEHRLGRHADRAERAVQVVGNYFASIAAKLGSAERFLASVNPARVLERGYAIVRQDGRVVTNPGTLAGGDRLHVQFAQGDTDVRVERATLL